MTTLIRSRSLPTILSLFITLHGMSAAAAERGSLGPDEISTAARLAVVEFKHDQKLEIAEPPGWVFRSLGTLRAMTRSYAKAYAGIYLDLWRKCTWQTFIGITEKPGTKAYSEKLIRMQRNLELAFWLSHQNGVEVCPKYVDLVLRARADLDAGIYHDYTAALEVSVKSFYQLDVHMSEIEMYFNNAIRNGQIYSAARLALDDFEYDHNLAIGSVPDLFLRTIGVLRGMESAYGRSYADVYIEWLYKTPANGRFPAITLYPGSDLYAAQISRMQKCIEFAFWLSRTRGDDIFKTYANVAWLAHNAWQSGRYGDFSEALKNSVASNYGTDVDMTAVQSYFRLLN